MEFFHFMRGFLSSAVLGFYFTENIGNAIFNSAISGNDSTNNPAHTNRISEIHTLDEINNIASWDHTMTHPNHEEKKDGINIGDDLERILSIYLEKGKSSNNDIDPGMDYVPKYDWAIDRGFSIPTKDISMPMDRNGITKVRKIIKDGTINDINDSDLPSKVRDGWKVVKETTSENKKDDSNLNDIIKNIEDLEKLGIEYYGQNLPNEIINFIRRKYNSLMWKVTGGDVDTGFVEYVRKKNSKLLTYFSDAGDGAELDDPESAYKIDFLHMMATLSGMGNSIGFVQDLSGWAGDVQQSIQDLQQYKLDNNTNDNLNNLVAAEKKIVAATYGKYKTFTINDMLGDIDAYNVGVLMEKSMTWSSRPKLSEILKEYYSDDVKKRYKNFVNNIGGIDELQKRTDGYTTKAEGYVQKSILNDKKISDITDNELRALNKGFMDYIKSHIEK